MANVTAVKTGNWSDPTVWNTGALPTSADDVFSNGFDVTIDQNVTVLSIRQSSPANTTSRGTFILTNGVVVSATSGGFISRANSFTAGFIIFNLSTPNSATLIGNLSHAAGDQVFTVDHSGTGTLNIIGNLIGFSLSGTYNLRITSTGTVNITGNLLSHTTPNATRGILASGNCVINITGDIIWRSNTTAGSSSIINITGASTLNITGTVYGGGNVGIESNGASYIKIIGSLIANEIVGGTVGSAAISSANASAINIFTGPFISSVTGIAPFRVIRMNYFRTIGSYYEFRDETTNGALPPSAPAPATRLVSPDTIVDSPIPANVRNGITYALGSLTGTLAVPSPSSVALGVATDNTTGSAVLTPDAIWDYATANLTDPNSIGARLKNVSTVETTGEQLEAFL
jgi:hypothetical protein